ncbi:hypothetical protein [Amycolatopsis kentuckyensis]|uniref:hypothetical protein n=1 Tax=Amycolatopsis kentuckyensis TaxID=218823 RepID=UPI000A3B6C87|nr:hypothetical protein [Amycolatopsis kentuckyensis]
MDAIVAALTTAFSGQSVNVWDGPVASGDYANAVYVGYDADPQAAEFVAATGLQQWDGLGAKKRAEDLDIVCAVLVDFVESEANSWKATRDAAFAIFDTVGQTLRANPSLGQAPPFVAEIANSRYSQEFAEVPSGDAISLKPQGRIVFGVHIKTRV